MQSNFRLDVFHNSLRDHRRVIEIFNEIKT